MGDLQQELNHISSYTSKLLRKKFGRGPELCSATFSGNYLILQIRGFISPMEEVLLEQGKMADVTKARASIIAQAIEELRGVVQVTLNVEVADCYNDWNFPNNTGVIILAVSGDKPQVQLSYIPQFEAEIARISQLVQKIPNSIETFVISEKLLVVNREGILIPIEKALISKGFEKELILTKDELEKQYFHRFGKFDEILSRNVRDIFIDWNLKEDKSLMVFVLQ
ncbi:Na-translocating system protein MpsC family protein [Halalkalibacter akibai]|uniref:Na+-translocating membrane potential-generating system MpsC domain-containing protein n=1 Tax=Halalkalibacter akibai (strain ATCC 43226 / DSM 21942 / CIP 109018 / JCM 9157 / 1139) TaxID=1236973 RepID=W4R0H3_HALA3|nr:Na-translocating system protein MpsC family protein [Halalkalibacter akibai]GAE37054.1 hypothetical protein JCM9157_4297 [Halalkalibacter akibai JCM 9157]